jgi:hypothetical protein
MVGVPIINASACSTVPRISPGVANSQLIDFTATPPLVNPQAIACAQVAVLP